ncbi:MAG: hypothetical protein ACE5JZ_09885 [Kiloniellales bacterium]
MSLHRYPMKALAGDYARAGAGMTVALGPLLFVTPGPVMIGLLGGLAALFLVFGLRTWRRHMTLVEVTEQGITTEASPLPAPRVSIPWRRLSGLKLRYYSTQRNRAQGWLQMGLSARDRTLWLDSGLDGFETVARRAAGAALANRVSLGPTTVSNLDALGIMVPPELQPVEGSGARR